MADDLREKIAEVLAGHDVAMTRDRYLVCFCEEWRVVTTGGPLDAEVGAHREHVAEAILAALGEPREEWAVRGNDPDGRKWLTAYPSEPEADEHLAWMGRSYPDLRPHAAKVCRTVIESEWLPVARPSTEES